MKPISAYDVANFFLYLDEFEDGSEGISNLKMQKLVYYAFGFYAALYDAYLFEDSIEAWQYGPVVPTLYEHYKARDYGRSPISFDKEVVAEQGSDKLFATFSAGQRQFMKEVFDEFGQYSAWRLRDMTHEERPWMVHIRKGNCTIPPEEIKDYFLTRI